jgi:hypothetical protein
MSRRSGEPVTDGASTPQAEPHDPAAGLPLEIRHAEMDAAYRTGRAVSLGRTIPWLARYRDAWWVVYERGWLRIDDMAAKADLDHLAARLSRAEAIATRDAAIRRAYRPDSGDGRREDAPWGD